MNVSFEDLENLTYKNNKTKKVKFEVSESYNISSEKYTSKYYIENCNIFENKSIKIKMSKNIFQYKADITLNTVKYTKVYGWVTDFNNNVIENIHVILYKKGYGICSDEYIPICSCTTDKMGMFQLVLPNHNKISDFKIQLYDI